MNAEGASSSPGDPSEVSRLARWPDRSVPEVLASVIERVPERTAIITPAGEISYRELGDRVRRVAAILSATQASGPRHTILLFDHGVDAIVAMLGALVAGQSYVMLDPGDPPDRLELIVGDALTGASGILLTHRDRRRQADELARGRCPVLDAGASDAAEDGDLPGLLDARVTPDHPAYVIYTSGSTGVPKGVVQTHRNLLYFIGRLVEGLEITESDRLSLVYTLSFSASNRDVYGSLLSGAALCPYDVRSRGVAGLADWIDRSGVTVLHCVPSLFRSLLRHKPDRAQLASVRTIDLGGETVLPADVSLWREHFAPDSVLVNHLAATEVSAIAQHVVSRDERGPVAVGVPPPGVALRVTRADGSSCDRGEVGEIQVSSPFVSPGYWNRAELTAAAFSDDPVRPGWRVYRSGDLGYLDPEGVLWRIGRADDRVKIRGHSVDLSEVETALVHASACDEAAVVAVESPTPNGGLVLVAYLAGTSRGAGEVRRALATRLPRYMIPAELHRLERLPRAASGKIDRKLLSGPDRPRAAFGRDLQPPRGEAERLVAREVCRVLGLEAVGRDEAFFDLGGTSLSAADLQIGVREALGIEITPTMLLSDSTVRGIARAATGRSPAPRVRRDTLLIPVNEHGSRIPLFLVHGRHLQAFLSPEFAAILGDDQPLYLFQGRTGTRAPSRIGAMAESYLAAMRAVQPHGPYFLGGLCLGAYVAHEMACRLHDAGQRLTPLLLVDPALTKPMGPLAWASRLVRLHLLRLRARIGLAAANVEEMRRHLEHREKRDGRRMQVSAREVAVGVASLGIARALHRPRVYPGAVRILASARRLDRPGGMDWEKRVSGDLRIEVVGEHHHEALDPRRPEFAAAVRRVQEEARRASTAGGVGERCGPSPRGDGPATSSVKAPRQ